MNGRSGWKTRAAGAVSHRVGISGVNGQQQGEQTRRQPQPPREAQLGAVNHLMDVSCPQSFPFAGWVIESSRWGHSASKEIWHRYAVIRRSARTISMRSAVVAAIVSNAGLVRYHTVELTLDRRKTNSFVGYCCAEGLWYLFSATSIDRPVALLEY